MRDAGTVHPPTTNNDNDTDEPVNAAMERAMAAHRDGCLRSPGVRVELLRSIAVRLEADADELIASAAAETHLGIERLRGELDRTKYQLNAFADMVDDGSWAAATIDPGPPDLRRMMRPIGPVVVFGASNFPFAFSTPGGDTASALAAGCPVVVKAHPAHPSTAERAAAVISDAVVAAGLPPGVFQQLAGAQALGSRLVEHPAAAAVAFTGSHAGGRALFDLAARRPTPIPVYAEMGSINPVFILPRAVEQVAHEVAAELADSVVLGCGQFCTNPGVVVAIDADAFAEQVAGELATRPSGTMLTVAIAESYRAAVQRLVDTPGIDVLTGPAEAGKPACALVSADQFLAQPELREEIFGPFTMVVSCPDERTMLDVASVLDGQLTATVHARDGDGPLAEAMIELLTERVGRLVWGGFPTGVAVSPAMQHGGPYPASTDGRSTSVGRSAIFRFLRPVAYQNVPEAFLPDELRNGEGDGGRQPAGS